MQHSGGEARSFARFKVQHSGRRVWRGFDLLQNSKCKIVLRDVQRAWSGLIPWEVQGATNIVSRGSGGVRSFVKFQMQHGAQMGWRGWRGRQPSFGFQIVHFGFWIIHFVFWIVFFF